jgi:membrane protein
MIRRPLRVAPPVAIAKRLPARLLLETFGFLRFVYRRWTEDRCAQIAGSLTYTTLLALVPAFVIAVAVLSTSPIFEDVMSKIKIFLLLNLTPEIAGRIITVYMEEFGANAARLTSVGIAFVFVLAVWLMLIMDRSLNAIWRVRQSRPYWLSALGYVVLLVAGPVLIGVSVSITTYIMALSAHATGLPATVHALLLRAVPVSMSTAAFFLIYRIIPHRKVPWRHALLGGVVAAFLFESAKQLFAFYVHTAPTYNLVYGAFAAVPLFLIWIYLSWLVILLGAEITAAAAYWGEGRWQQAEAPATRFRDMVDVVRSLAEAAPAAVSFERLRQRTGIPAQELEDTLSRMAGEGVLERQDRDGYSLAKSSRGAPAAPAGVTKAKRGKARSGKSSR